MINRIASNLVPYARNKIGLYTRKDIEALAQGQREFHLSKTLFVVQNIKALQEMGDTRGAHKAVTEFEATLYKYLGEDK